MARFTFGAGSGDTVVQAPAPQSPVLRPILNAAATGTFWSAQTGGTQYTDLVDATSLAAIPGLSTDQYGRVKQFKGPDGVMSGWVDFGAGRFFIAAYDGIFSAGDNSTAGYVGSTGSATQGALDGRYAKKSPAVVNVVDYGAVADNATDCLAAFQAARDAVATNGTVLVPAAANRYYLSGQLDLSAKPVQIVGSGWTCTIQPAYNDSQFTGTGITGSVLRFGNTTGAGIYIGAGNKAGGVKDVAIIGPGTGSSRGLQIGDTAAMLRYRVERVLVGNWFQGFWTCMENSTVAGLYAVGNDSGVTLTNASNGNTFTGLNVEKSSTYGVRIDGSSVNLFDGGVFQGNSGTTISIVNASSANIFDSIYLENVGATWGVDAATGCDYNQFRSMHFGYSTTHDQVRLASGHNAILWPQVAPQVTVTGASNFFIGLFGNGTNSDTGSNNVWIDTSGGMGVKFGARDVRISSGQKFVFETAGNNAYIMRESATGDTIIGSGSNVTRLTANGSLAANVSTVTGNTTVVNQDVLVCNGSSITATLPDPTTVRTGRIVRIKNVNATNLTVVSAGTSKTVDGAASVVLAQWAKAECVSDGTQWLTI